MAKGHSPRSDCKHQVAKKTAQKTRKKTETGDYRVIRFGEKDDHEFIGDPVANERAALRRARGSQIRDQKHTFGVINGCVCTQAFGPDRETVLGKQF